jgi:hypothetical protein
MLALRKRFDTDVPLQFYGIAKSVAEELYGGEALFSKSSIDAEFARLLDGLEGRQSTTVSGDPCARNEQPLPGSLGAVRTLAASSPSSAQRSIGPSSNALVCRARIARSKLGIAFALSGRVTTC